MDQFPALLFRNFPTPVKPVDFRVPDRQPADAEIAKSVLGTPVFCDIEFIGASYESQVPGIFKSFRSINLQTVLMTVSQMKFQVKTQLQGRPGTVKEYICDGDYVVQINGIIVGTNSNGNFPATDVQDFKRMLDAPIPIGITSRYLQLLGINSIVIDDYTFNQEEGGYSYQPFSINASSDILQELRIT